MKREIKFRGKRIDNGDWIYGGIYVYEKINRFFMVDLAWFAPESQNWQIKGIEVIPKTVGQFTGLHDKNGKEIYEGDILDFDEREWGGRFTPEVITFDKITGDWHLCGSFSDLTEWRQVIGNIHENPELL